MKLLWQSVGHKFSEARSACYLLDWSGEIVAEGHWSSSDPNIMVHGIPLGAKFMRVWVDIAKAPSAYLFRPNHEMLTVGEAVGSTVAWPAEKVIARGSIYMMRISYFHQKFDSYINLTNYCV